MKPVVTLFLFLCLHLAGSFYCAHASVLSSKISYSQTLSIKNFPGVESTTTYHDYRLKENVGLSEENQVLLSVEDDGEDDDVIRKHVSSVRYSLSFYYAFNVSIEDSLLFRKQLSYSSSCKYIEQRALRI